MDKVILVSFFNDYSIKKSNFFQA